MCRNELSFAEFKRALAFAQPFLELIKVKEGFVATGRYVLNDGPHSDGPIENFEIEILVDQNFPKIEPIVRETAGRIPREIDRHMYGSSRCCTCVWEEWLAISDDVSFSGFVQGPLHNFFLSQLHFELHDDWPFGERSHGSAGFVESVSRILGFRVNRTEALVHLNTLTAEKIKGHRLCVCGSNKKVRDCDPDHIDKLRTSLDLVNLSKLKSRLLSQMKVGRRSGR